MKFSQEFRDGLEVTRTQPLLLEERERIPVRCQSAHHDDMLTVGIEWRGGDLPDGYPISFVQDGCDSEVDGGGQTPIEFELSKAIFITQASRREVEEG